MTENFRKLATIRQVKKIEPIKDADKIELITVDGWEVVSQKGLHKVGDFVIYCEIDSLLPIQDEFEFLRKSSYKKMADGSEGFRLRTIKLRGQISQGLILPLEVINSNITINNFWEGMDVTDILNIKKYEPPIPAELSGEVKGAFPSFIQKTDEERIQNMAGQFPEITKEGVLYYETEKLDGTSCTFYLKNGEFGICGRNWEYKKTETNTFWRLSESMKIEEKMRKFGRNIAIQGECIGEGIQGNRYKLIGQTVRFFNVFLIDTYERANFHEFRSVIDVLGLETVPILNSHIDLSNYKTIDELIKSGDGISKLNVHTKREGKVIRQMYGSLSFKVISNEFLINEE